MKRTNLACLILTLLPAVAFASDGGFSDNPNRGNPPTATAPRPGKPNPTDPTRRRPTEVEVSGEANGTPFAFEGRSREELYASCEAWGQEQSITTVTDLTVDGQTADVGDGLSLDDACNAVAQFAN
jgi:hypothetical protein